MKKVSVYGNSSWQLNLADLNRGRYQHACSMFLNSKGNKVGTKRFWEINIIFFKKIFLVNGGKNHRDYLLSSTELLEDKLGSKWREIYKSNLQTGLGSHKILTINNNIYLFGEQTFTEALPYSLIFIRRKVRQTGRNSGRDLEDEHHLD